MNKTELKKLLKYFNSYNILEYKGTTYFASSFLIIPIYNPIIKSQIIGLKTKLDTKIDVQALDRFLKPESFGEVTQGWYYTGFYYGTIKVDKMGIVKYSDFNININIFNTIKYLLDGLDVTLVKNKYNEIYIYYDSIKIWILSPLK